MPGCIPRINRVRSILLAAAMRKTKTAAILSPRSFARSLAEDIYGPESPSEGVRRYSEERSRYLKLVDRGGFVGTIFNVPLVVVDDSILCAVTEDDIKHLPVEIEQKIVSSLLKQYDLKSTSSISG